MVAPVALEEPVPEKKEGSSTPETLPVAPLESAPGASLEKLASPEQHTEQSAERYQEALTKVTPGKTASDDTNQAVVADAGQVGVMTDEESKIQKLIDLAQTKGVPHAVKVARSLKDYYALDRMHDELVDRLYQGLLEKGLITRE